MKVLVVHNRYRSTSPSGEDRVVDQEVDALEAAGHDVRRFERFSDDIAQFSVPGKVLVPVRVVRNPRTARQLDGALQEFGPDVVHLHNLFPLIGSSVLDSCQRQSVPCVVTFHNYRHICPGGALFRTGSACRDCVGHQFAAPGVLHGCYRSSSVATLPIAVANTVHRQAWRRVPSAYIFLSAGQQHELESLELPPSRCFVKPNFVPPVSPKEATGNAVVYLGRLTEAKGLRVLMQAWDEFTAGRTTPGLRLSVAGSGPLEEEIRSWAETRPSVEMHGLLSREACAALVHQARAVVAPSEWPEPFGLVVVEAMAAGVAPVATAHGSFVDMITDGVDGLLYPPGDVGSLARVLRQVEESPARLAELGAAAQQTYERRFTPAANIAGLEGIYRFAVDHPRWLDRQPAALLAASGPPGVGGAVVGRPTA
jgi:glycosyltransferase involved in cell wall biosynthesis